MPRRPSSDPLSLPLARWPEPDRSLWHRARAAAGLFDDPGAGSDWAPATWTKTGNGYGRFLAWLARHHPQLLALPPAERLTQDVAAAYVRHLAASTSGFGALSYVEDLARALRLLSGQPVPDWLRRLQASLAARARPATDKRQRLVAADELVRCGMDLLRRAGTAPGWSARRRAVAFRDGLAVALLAYRPLRMKNFSRLRLGVELVREQGAWQLLLSAADTKTHHPFEAPFPAALVPQLEVYLARHRPVLLRGERGSHAAGTDALWVSETGTAWQQGAMSARIARTTEAFLGRRVPAHWFRDAAATTIAIDAPASIGDAHHVLGHAGPQTTEKHYIQAESLAASRHHLHMLDALRSELRHARVGEDGSSIGTGVGAGGRNADAGSAGGTAGSAGGTAGSAGGTAGSAGEAEEP